MPNGLTVLIPCKNERANLAAVVASARPVADEVLVADSGSTDGTRELAQELGCRVIEREYGTSGDFKNWAIPQAAHEWVLILDADERMSPAMAEEIDRRLRDADKLDGFWVPRVNHFFGRALRFGAWRPTNLLRLFRRDRGRYTGGTDHAVILMPPARVGRFRGPILHYAMSSYEDYLPKLYRYADVQARIWQAEGRRASFGQMLFRAPLRFLQDYVLRGGVLDGAAGLQTAVLMAYGSYLKQVRLWELEHTPAEATPAKTASPAPPPRIETPRRVESAA